MKTIGVFAISGLMAVSAAIGAEDPGPLKNAPGRMAVENYCGACHSLDYIRINSPFMNRQTWTAEVNKMINAFGAPIRQNDAATIIDYLSANYGDK
jgi:sulfite dehydrogenase (cytochrome) subunit B